DLSVNLTAPTAAGHYKALFKISNTSGAQFGIGDSAGDAFWADINVVETNAVIYDFTANASHAQWKSGAGVLPFPGTSGDSRGFAYQVDHPHLEDDSLDATPGLMVVPQNKFNGYIQAAYPEFQVQQGDHLQTLVNCEFGATRCYTTFRIDYILPNGVQRTLWTWKEAYDKRFYRLDLDLSSLAGQKVRFVFMLLSTGTASGDRAIWGSPRIVRAGTTQPPAPPATLTALPPPPPTPTPFSQPPTVEPSGCDKAAFVSDVTVPDGTIFSPSAAFTKTWRLRNIGTCTWTTSYKLIYYSGDSMSAPTTVNFPWSAAWNQTVDISLNMVAPNAVGKYRGYWILSNASGQLFGIGSTARDPVWVEINVSGEAPHEGGYNFWQNACSAQWKSGAGLLPCPGTEGDSKGFIIPVNNSHLEDGTMGPAPSLLISPENKYNGYIQGIFPTFTVQPGDHFVSVVGCEYGYSCYVTFRLDYMTANGGIFNFWSWREKSDNQNYMTNIDLSPLAGRSVRFILTVLTTGSSSGDRVRWGAPSIVRAGTTITATPASQTPTPTQTNVPGDWLSYTNSAWAFELKYPLDVAVVFVLR
ncbi:MAG TPA: NBR1-Ig-like domain-containing protein, partial [Anaerolineales bacterium]|nr:NBR1-Ig-like domain-containing protein [Anaerolineales bacterium]